VAVERVSFGDIFMFQNGAQRDVYQSQPEAFQAVVRGQAGAAFLWALIGWWLVKQHPAAQVQAVDVSVPNLEFKMAAGVRKGDEAFQNAVNAAIQQLIAQEKVAELLSCYGRPSPALVQAPQATQATGPSQSSRSLYYQSCAPCHGQSAEGDGPVPDLRTFPGPEEQFLKIALTGRSDRGMPAWKGKLAEDELRAVLAFIQTLPK
jgi:mono/diheme cytochrome c family protein